MSAGDTQPGARVWYTDSKLLAMRRRLIHTESAPQPPEEATSKSPDVKTFYRRVPATSSAYSDCRFHGQFFNSVRSDVQPSPLNQPSPPSAAQRPQSASARRFHGLSSGQLDFSMSPRPQSARTRVISKSTTVDSNQGRPSTSPERVLHVPPVEHFPLHDGSCDASSTLRAISVDDAATLLPSAENSSRLSSNPTSNLAAFGGVMQSIGVSLEVPTSGTDRVVLVDRTSPLEDSSDVTPLAQGKSTPRASPGLDSASQHGSTRQLQKNESRVFLNKMREAGSAALALTRIHKVNSSISLDDLRDAGVDLTALNTIVDRIPRFFNLVRGKLLLQRLRHEKSSGVPSTAGLVDESLKTVEPHVMSLLTCGHDFRIAARDGGATGGATWLLVDGNEYGVGVSTTHVGVREASSWVCMLPLRRIVGLDISPSHVTASLEHQHECIDLFVANSPTTAVVYDQLVRSLCARFSLCSTIVRRVARKSLHVVHFNDVYHLEPFKHDGPGVVGGASRFLTKLRQIQTEHNPLILFSGDFMSPSLQSVLMRGKHIIDAFNLIGVHYGTFGNHEFDYGLDALRDCIDGSISGNFVFAGSNTQWVMSNMVGSDGKPLCGAAPYVVTTWGSARVGILGLSENWLPQCNQLQPSEAFYMDVFAEGERLARYLKEYEGADCVIALTHSRLSTDKEMATRCPSIDLILGGHDHFYKRLPAYRLVKSGEEFEYLTELEVTIDEDKTVKTRSAAHPIVRSIVPDPAMEKIIARYETRVRQRMGKVIGITTVPLDCTEECCRFKEGLLPGFFCDVMVEQTHADFAVLGGAAIAGKAVMPAGDITLGDVFNWFPGDTRVMTVKIPGSTVEKLLNVMVREVPAEAPSFPHPSAELQFTINTMHTPATVKNILVRGEPLVADRMYTVAVEDFVGLGKAKYKFIPKEGEPLVDEESAEQITYWIIDHFDAKRKKALASTTTSMEHDTTNENCANDSQSRAQAPSNANRGLALMAHTALARNALKRKSAASDSIYSQDGLGSLRGREAGDAAPLSQALLSKLLAQSSYLSSAANKSFDELTTAACYAVQRLVPCNLVRMYCHNSLAGSSWCLAPVCQYVRPTRVAAHPSRGTYNYVRRVKRPSITDDVRNDPHFHRPSEGHPRGEPFASMYTAPVLMSGTLSCVVQLVEPREPITEEQQQVIELFASSVGTFLFLAHQREVKEQSDLVQKQVLNAAVEMLSGNGANAMKLFDQIVHIGNVCRDIFQARDAQLLMVDFNTSETWTVVGSLSKKGDGAKVVRKPFSADPWVEQVIQSGLPTLQDPDAPLLFDGVMERSMSAKEMELTNVLAVPVFRPNTTDIMCVLRLAERNRNEKFTPNDEDAAINLSAFVAVCIHTSSEVEALRTGVNRSQLKLFPIHELGRIKWMRGWGSVRSKLKIIISRAFQSHLDACNDAEVFENPTMERLMSYGTSMSADVVVPQTAAA